MRKMRAILFGTLLCGLLAMTASADTITLNTGKTWLRKVLISGGGGFIDNYMSEPFGTYETRAHTCDYQSVIELGDNNPVPTGFVPYSPSQFPITFATGIANPIYSNDITQGVTVNWRIPGDGYHYGITAANGPGLRAMRIQLKGWSTIYQDFVMTAESVAGL